MFEYVRQHYAVKGSGFKETLSKCFNRTFDNTIQSSGRCDYSFGICFDSCDMAVAF